jgi:hypothetical protein
MSLRNNFFLKLNIKIFKIEYKHKKNNKKNNKI